jgi:hypothetical protein
MCKLIDIKLILSVFFFLRSLIGFGQVLQTGQNERYNPIITAVPFLMITPDSRHAAMGDAGAATSPDANSQFFNPSKYAFIEGKSGFSFSYTPWLHQLVRDNYLTCLSGFYRLDDIQAIGSSLRYFSMGNVLLTGEDQSTLASVKPHEYAIDFSYSRKLSDKLSGGVALRYIRSDVNGGIDQGYYSPAKGFAVDVSCYCFKSWGTKGYSKSLAFGTNISNLGSKISYNQGSNNELIPANMRIGSTFSKDLDRYSSLSLSLDLSKLLVPTPTTKITESDGTVIVVPSYGSDQPVISSIFNSFSDAPGGFREEMQEINLSFGLEYLYLGKFALRTGYFNEPVHKGNRKFLTAGAGFSMNFAHLDFSYIIPTRQDNPLSNTIRLSLLFNVETLSKKKVEAQLSSL